MEYRIWTVKFYKPVPKMYIAYDRMAYFGKKDSALRMTFDKNIRSREDSLRLQDGDEGRLLLDKEYRLLEIKVAGAFPIEIARILSELEIYPVSFSKYGNIYKSKMKDCAAGLATAMGCLVFAATLTIVVGVIFIVCENLFNGFNTNQKALRITIPENLDYTSVFDDIFSKYTKKAELINVKTTNMGSMFELKYMIDVKADINEKQMIDEIRCKNGNLTVICSHNLQQGEAL